jgi:hypothetical protein
MIAPTAEGASVIKSHSAEILVYQIKIALVTCQSLCSGSYLRIPHGYREALVQLNNHQASLEEEQMSSLLMR